MENFDDKKAVYKPSTEVLEQCIDIFSTFSNLDTMRIFLLAEKGIINSNKAIKELGLTPKRYYSRLKELVDIGVLEKVNGVYVYTPIGEILHNLGFSLINLIINRGKIGLLSNLMKSEALSNEERQKISSVIIGKNDIGVIFRSMVQGMPQEKIEKISEYNVLVEKLVYAIASSKKSVLLASRYFEILVVDECLKAHERGNELRVLVSKEIMSNKINKLKMMLSPQIVMKMLEISNGKKIDDFIREIELSFSFCIIDGSECFFEFPSVGRQFSIAFKLKDNATSKKFTQLFNSTWESRDVNKTPIILKEMSG